MANCGLLLNDGTSLLLLNDGTSFLLLNDNTCDAEPGAGGGGGGGGSIPLPAPNVIHPTPEGGGGRGRGEDIQRTLSDFARARRRDIEQREIEQILEHEAKLILKALKDIF